MSIKTRVGVIVGVIALGILGTAPAEAAPSEPARPVHMWNVTDVKYAGKWCGGKNNVISATKGKGKTTLVLSVSKSVSAEWSSEVGIDAGSVSAKVGFKVDESYTVENQTRFEVPKGRMGFVEAHPLYVYYTFKASLKFTPKVTQKGLARKPIGVCFKEWTQKA
ncbi:hypothetical protein ABZ442_25275 [Streptomyces triculaminicus]|uniref:hypothetical protein n=1 Tax=Streptomyces triculaminicus TaxID=2816232 RepID=UPI0033C08396